MIKNLYEISLTNRIKICVEIHFSIKSNTSKVIIKNDAFFFTSP